MKTTTFLYLLLIALPICSVNGQNETDTIKPWNLYRPQAQINKDSIDALRLKFVQDSIQARQKFVHDSIEHRKQMLDSVTFLRAELQPILEAIYWTTGDDIVSHSDQIPIIADSTLGDFVYHKLPLGLYDPYAPWKGQLSLKPKQIRFTIDKNLKKVSSIQSPSLKCSLNYANQGAILIVHEDFILQKNSSGNFFRYPIDSIFFDRSKRLVKIKRYVQFYDLNPAGNKKGSLLFTNLSQVKQFQYDANNQMNKYELVKFCDRYKSYDKNEVCSIINYSIAKQGNNYLVTRHNNPENEFSDGIFTLELDNFENVKSLSFKTLTNVLQWQRFVELNKDGNVDCYIDKMKDVIGNKRCMIYHKEPNAQYPVEVVNTKYDKDGIDYLQTNLTTGKSRERNKMTLEWGPWK